MPSPDTPTLSDVDQLTIDTIRTLSMDAVEAAKSGHPGTPMALAPVAYTVWKDFLRYDPLDPSWPNRDRFVLSCGHASMLLYSLIHLAGIRQGKPNTEAHKNPAVSLDDIRAFRQLDSVCAGHPEHHLAVGVETTTGPLGQGCANSVGMAISSRWLGEQYNRPGSTLFDFDTYVLCSDGDLMEGVASESASLAGHLQLANLCWIYDDNKITIEGETDLAFSENVGRRFEGFGWRIEYVDDANDASSLSRALEAFKQETEKPTLIVVKSIIGFGAPTKAGSHSSHGAPLGPDEINGAKEAYAWPTREAFHVPDGVTAHFQNSIGTRGQQAHASWQAAFQALASSEPSVARNLDCMLAGELPDGWADTIPEFPADEKGLASRVSSGKVLQSLSSSIPWFLGGSADLAPSTMTLIPDAGDFGPKNLSGRNFHFGIREHAMAAACNGMALCGLRPYAATFFVFFDYLKPALRLSALGELGVIYVLTHDSIGLGEDGPTHQPIEHLASARAVPGLNVFRPADANEVAEAYRSSLLNSKQPAVMVLSRQNLPTLDRTNLGPANGVSKGGYILKEAEGGKAECILIGTGSEVQLCLDAAHLLESDGIRTRVVSLPCWELFAKQDIEYQEHVLPSNTQARVACEAASGFGWEKWLGQKGTFIGMNGFGASGPAKKLFEHFGITAEAVVAAARDLVGR